MSGCCVGGDADADDDCDVPIALLSACTRQKQMCVSIRLKATEMRSNSATI